MDAVWVMCHIRATLCLKSPPKTKQKCVFMCLYVLISPGPVLILSVISSLDEDQKHNTSKS